jgi:type III restriction enzyme
VAIDEQKEVLIFKVAVALGFDAPRAFTLVSMRGAKDTDFGIQVVGRILRVHSRLQGPTLEQKLPELLRSRLCVSGRCGESKRLGACRREDQRDPERAVAGLPIHDGGEGGRAQRNSGDAQWAGAIAVGALHAARLAAPPTDSGERWTVCGRTAGLAADRDSDESGADATGSRPQRRTQCRTSPLLSGNRRFPMRDGVPRVYRAERLPLSTGDLLTCIAANIAIDDKVFQAGFRQSVKVTRQIVDCSRAARKCSRSRLACPTRKSRDGRKA